MLQATLGQNAVVPVESLVIGKRGIPLPTFFPSVSSTCLNARPSEYVRLLASLAEGQCLVSAYDIASEDESERASLRDALSGVGEQWPCAILLDSGNYERYRRGDKTWTAARYAEVLTSSVADVAFSFDDLQPSADAVDVASEVCAGVLRDQKYTERTTVCPIVHGTSPGAVVESVRLVAERLQPVLVAVAERELGDGLVARARTIQAIRRGLDVCSPTAVLHVLGTGSPIAILAYAVAGAQSFDGLEWCQTCVDPDSAQLHHFHHRELVRNVEPALVGGLPYTAATLAHNLLFFRSWMTRVRQAISTGSGMSLLGAMLPAGQRDHILEQLKAP